jgi:hypothetical protein
MIGPCRWPMSACRSRRSGVRAGSLALLLAAVAGAGHVLAGDEPEDRARQLQRDQHMIESLVQSGLKLAAEVDPLRRADQCNRLADRFAREIKLAVQKKDATRAALFGEQIQALLVKGVAGNLHAAWASLAPNSPREPEILRLGVEVADTAKSIEDEFSNHPELEREKMQSTLDALARGKAEVEQAVKGRGKSKY